MTKKKIINELKKFCEHELWATKRFNYNPHDAITRCHGAVMFVINMDDYFDADLARWWNDKMLPQFRELERR